MVNRVDFVAAPVGADLRVRPVDSLENVHNDSPRGQAHG
jgi:hypothetical protein